MNVERLRGREDITEVYRGLQCAGRYNQPSSAIVARISSVLTGEVQTQAGVRRVDAGPRGRVKSDPDDEGEAHAKEARA